MTKPIAAANAAGLPVSTIADQIDDARYSVAIAADLCDALKMACEAIAKTQRTGLLAIHRALHDRLDLACDQLDVAQVRALQSEVRS